MSKFLKFSLVSVLAIGTFSIAPTFAQEDGDVEEVIVTGSKIKKVDIYSIAQSHSKLLTLPKLKEQVSITLVTFFKT